MGMFSKNRTSLGSYNSEEIIANENYYGATGALQITLEGLQNQQELFNACMEQDFAETAGLLSGAITESSQEYQIMAESAIGGFVTKIKEMIKKVWAKIKGLFETFIKKINNVIIRDNKEFVNKYKKEVLTKDLTEMKFKARKPKKLVNFESDILEAQMAIDAITVEVAKAPKGNLEKMDDELSDGTWEDSVYADIVKGADKESFKKDFFEDRFDDEEEHEGLKAADVSYLIKVLCDKKIVSDMQKDQKAIDKIFNKYLTTIDKSITELSKTIPNGAQSGKVNISRDPDADYGLEYNKDNKDEVMHRLNLIQKYVSTSQSIYTNASSCEIEVKKFEIAQARRIFAKAVAYNPKKVNESAVFVESAGDAAFYDVMSSFEDYEM